jgi:hypothetical protein
MLTHEVGVPKGGKCSGNLTVVVGNDQTNRSVCSQGPGLCRRRPSVVSALPSFSGKSFASMRPVYGGLESSSVKPINGAYRFAM